MKKRNQSKAAGEVIPLFGRDEMNLVEFPIGPVSQTNSNTFEVVQHRYDRTLKREISRRLLVTGSDAFGLPKPVDDQVLIGMKALTCHAGFASRKVEFSRYQLCRTIGWGTDGRAYKRLEESLDRIAGTTLKYKDAWFDKADSEWKSKTFHLIDNVELCSKDRLVAARIKRGSAKHALCSFVWNEVVWKSFEDGYMRKLDMEMFRRIRSGRRREVPLRLFRVLDKRFYHSKVPKFCIEKLATGILGLKSGYSPSQQIRVLERAANWLIECGYISEMTIQPNRSTGRLEVHFRKAKRKRAASDVTSSTQQTVDEVKDDITKVFEGWSVERQESLLAKALDHCLTAKPALVSGYRRTEQVGGEAFRNYRMMVINELLRGQSQSRNAA